MLGHGLLSRPTVGGMSAKSSRATASSPVTSAATATPGRDPGRGVMAVPAATGPRTTRTQPHGTTGVPAIVPGATRTGRPRPTGGRPRGATGTDGPLKGPARDPVKGPVKGRVSSQPPDGRSAPQSVPAQRVPAPEVTLAAAAGRHPAAAASGPGGMTRSARPRPPGTSHRSHRSHSRSRASHACSRPAPSCLTRRRPPRTPRTVRPSRPAGARPRSPSPAATASRRVN